jgi:catechol 2,3-dioxygenase-like lactoylglutathione lyase family enzyme
MKLTRIVPNLAVTNTPRTTEVLTRLLDLQVGMDQGWIATLVDPAAPDRQISLLTRDLTAPFVANISVGVEDVNAFHARAHELTGELGLDIAYPITDEPWGVRRFMVRLPDGQIVNLVAHQ